MTVLRRLKWLLAAIIALFVAAGAYISVLIVERQEALKEVSRYNVVWLISQATTEFARLEERVAAFAVPSSGIDKDEVELRLEILFNRLELLKSGDADEFVQTGAEHRDTIAALAAAIAKVQPLVAELDRPGAVEDVLSILTPLDAKLARLAAAANRYGGDRAGEDQQQLVRLHWLFSSLAAGLLLFGLGLIVLLVWHNRLLQRAHQDVHARDRALQARNAQFDAALNNMSQGLCMVDGDQRVIVCNARFLAMFGLPAEAVEPGIAVTDLFGRIVSGEAARACFEPISAEQQLLIRERKPGAYAQDLPDGRTLSVSHQPMAGGGWVATYDDVTERRRVEARIAYMAHHDALTDLPNRVLFRERMEQALARVRRYGEQASILCLDLDRFKSVNDTLGHPVGDALLKAVAARITGALRESDVVARLGGDEFAVLHLGLEQPREADALARRLLDVISPPYDIDGQQVIVGASIGIAIAPGDGATPDQLLKNADMALYRAKAEGRSTHRFFEAEMDAQLQARRRLELDLRKALGGEELELYFQPLVNLASNTVTGCEALLRWRHPERGMVSPAEFVPVAEEIGLIVPIGDWVLRRACAEAAAWPGRTKVAVNLSAVQFRNPSLVQSVVLALASSGLPASRLEIEITESVLIQDETAALATLRQLRGLGVHISMDDFGTGYSSLSYLRSFPFDKIKIDKSFVRDLAGRPDCLAIVRSIAGLGASLGMATTAEGVETAEELEQLRLAGCTEAQGYYFARPQPADGIRRLLAPAAAVRAA